MEKPIINTSNKFHPRNILISAIVFGIIGAFFLIFTHASGTATFVLSPAATNTTVNTSTQFSTDIQVSMGTAQVNTVDVKLNYDATKLDFISVSSDGGPLTTCFENGLNGGKVSLVCTLLGGTITGNNVKIGKVIFQTKTVAGSTSISTDASSHIYTGAAVENWSGAIVTNSYNIVIPDTTPPTVSITAPAANATVTGTATAINATASDLTSSGTAGTISKVEFYVNGVLKATDTATPYTYTWDTTTIVDGTYPIIVKAYDGATPTANMTQATINVTVQNSKPDLSVTSVTLSPSNPRRGDVVTISSVIANASGASSKAIVAGTSKAIEYKIDTTVLSTVADTQAIAVGGNITVTSTVTWTATRGNHDIIVTADKSGQIAESNETNNSTTKSIVVYIPGDVDNNGTVGSSDLSILSSNYGKTGPFTFLQGNLNEPIDTIVNSADLSILSNFWGTQ